MTRRVFRGESPFKADQIHLHHILLRYGFGREEAVKIILLLCILLCSLSFLGPLNGFSDRILFAIYLGYASLFLIACGYIVWAFRQGRHLKDGEHLLDRLPAVKTARKWFRLSHIVRKAKRHPVNLVINCTSEAGRRFQGTVLNISSDGFMASINELDWIDENFHVKISFSFASGERVFASSVEHLWMHQRDDRVFHGFRFVHEGSRRERLSSLIDEAVGVISGRNIAGKLGLIDDGI